MSGIGSSVSGINSEVQKISLIAGIPGAAASLCDPLRIGTSIYPNTIQQSGNIILTSGSPGAWITLIAVLTNNMRWMTVLIRTAPGLGTVPISLAKGTAGSEISILGPVIAETGLLAGINIINIPFYLPINTRISGRCEDAASTITINLLAVTG